VGGEVSAYLDRSQDDEEEEDKPAPPRPPPQLFNLLFDRFDDTPKARANDQGTPGPAAQPQPQPQAKDKGKEKVSDAQDDDVTVEL
jgi:hypothetical protein